MPEHFYRQTLLMQSMYLAFQGGITFVMKANLGYTFKTLLIISAQLLVRLLILVHVILFPHTSSILHS